MYSWSDDQIRPVLAKDPGPVKKRPVQGRSWKREPEKRAACALSHQSGGLIIFGNEGRMILSKVKAKSQVRRFCQKLFFVKMNSMPNISTCRHVRFTLCNLIETVFSSRQCFQWAFLQSSYERSCATSRIRAATFGARNLVRMKSSRLGHCRCRQTCISAENWLISKFPQFSKKKFPQFFLTCFDFWTWILLLYGPCQSEKMKYFIALVSSSVNFWQFDRPGTKYRKT